MDREVLRAPRWRSSRSPPRRACTSCRSLLARGRGGRRRSHETHRDEGRGQPVLRRGAGAGGPRADRRERRRVTVPDTVEEVLGGRIGRLAAEERRLLEVASVVGKDVPSAAPLLTDSPDAQFREGLRKLQAAEFLYEVASGGDPEYAFRHALTQEVAYGLLSAHQRRLLHARIVEAIQKLFAGRVEATSSGSPITPERGAVGAGGGLSAGRGNARLRALREPGGGHWFEQALDALGHCCGRRRDRPKRPTSPGYA